MPPEKNDKVAADPKGSRFLRGLDKVGGPAAELSTAEPARRRGDTFRTLLDAIPAVSVLVPAQPYSRPAQPPAAPDARPAQAAPAKKSALDDFIDRGSEAPARPRAAVSPPNVPAPVQPAVETDAAAKPAPKQKPEQKPDKPRSPSLVIRGDTPAELAETAESIPPPAPVKARVDIETLKNVDRELQSILSEPGAGPSAPETPAPARSEAPPTAADPPPAQTRLVPAQAQGDARKVYEEVENKLASIFGDESPSLKPAATRQSMVEKKPPSAAGATTAGARSKKLAPVAPAAEAAAAQGKPKPKPKPDEPLFQPPSSGLSDFVSRVMNELDSKMTGKNVLAETAEFQTAKEPDAPAAAKKPAPTADASKPGQEMTKQAIEALKDIFRED